MDLKEIKGNYNFLLDLRVTQNYVIRDVDNSFYTF